MAEEDEAEGNEWLDLKVCVNDCLFEGEFSLWTASFYVIILFIIYSRKFFTLYLESSVFTILELPSLFLHINVCKIDI